MTETVPSLQDVLLARRIDMAYQPVVDLTHLDTVGFEALARPAGQVDGSAQSWIAGLSAEARRRGVLGDLDEIRRVSALSDPLIDDLPSSLAWFVDAEPACLAAVRATDLAGDGGPHRRDDRVVLEVTERGVHADPHAVITGVDVARAAGLGVALADVGVDPRALALLGVLAPDVVKLDGSLVRRPKDPRTRQVTDAVRAYAERAGAAVVAQGIENADDVETARSLGATHGQGRHLGRPGPLPHQLPAPAVPLLRRVAAERLDRPDPTPFEILVRSRPSHRGTRRLLTRMTSHIEDQVGHHREPLALLATFQHRDDMTAAIVARYARLAQEYAFLAVFGPGLPDLRGTGVLRVDLDPTDPLLTEWTVVVVGPHYGCALSARATGTGSGDDEVFDHVVSHDRRDVDQVARAVTARMPVRL